MQAIEPFFQQKINAASLVSSNLQKVIVALCMLAYDSPIESRDDTSQMVEDTISKCTRLIIEIMVTVYGEPYVRAPNAKDTAKLLATQEAKC